MKIRENKSVGLLVLAVATLSPSPAYCITPYIDFSQVFAMPQEDLVNDSFGDGYGFIADCGIRKDQFCFGLGLGFRSYFDRRYYSNYEYAHVSKLGWLSLYNINFSIRGDLIGDQSGTSIFWGVGAGIYFGKWDLKKASFYDSYQYLYTETGQRKFPGFEFQLGFEIPIDTKISIRSTLNYSHLITDIKIKGREYRNDPDYEVPYEREFTTEYRGINLGGKLLGIGLIYKL